MRKIGLCRPVHRLNNLSIIMLHFSAIISLAVQIKYTSNMVLCPVYWHRFTLFISLLRTKSQKHLTVWLRTLLLFISPVINENNKWKANKHCNTTQKLEHKNIISQYSNSLTVCSNLANYGVKRWKTGIWHDQTNT